MYLDTYFKSIETVFEAIQTSQRTPIKRAAKAVAASLGKSGGLFVMDTGHMLQHEAVLRAGGLIATTPFSYSLTVENPLDTRTPSYTPKEDAEIEARTVAAALDRSKLRKGDVLIINSNSGRTNNVIEIALQCKRRSITTIAICSREQMKQCGAVHPSGKKLFDVADVCIDNCTPHGDALVEVRDNEKMCPSSGMAAAYIFWAIQAETVELLQDRGINPSIYRSVHVSGQAFVESQQKKFRKRGI